MDMFHVSQMMFLLISMGSAGVYIFALVCVLAWPQVRSRGLFLSALGLKVLTAAAYLLLHLTQVIGLRSEPWFPMEVLQVVYVLLATISLAADATLAAAFLSLGNVFRLMQRNSQGKIPPLSPPPAA